MMKQTMVAQLNNGGATKQWSQLNNGSATKQWQRN
jgi:hypothetical protein